MPNIVDTVTTEDGTCTVHLFTPDGRESQAPWPGVIMFPDGRMDIQISTRKTKRRA